MDELKRGIRHDSPLLQATGGPADRETERDYGDSPSASPANGPMDKEAGCHRFGRSAKIING